MSYPYYTDIVIRSQEDVEKYIDVKLARHIFIAKGVEANLPNLQHASQDVQIEGHIVAEKLRSIHGELFFKNSAQAPYLPVLIYIGKSLIIDNIIPVKSMPRLETINKLIILKQGKVENLPSLNHIGSEIKINGYLGKLNEITSRSYHSDFIVNGFLGSMKNLVSIYGNFIVNGKVLFMPELRKVAGGDMIVNGEIKDLSLLHTVEGDLVVNGTIHKAPNLERIGGEFVLNGKFNSPISSKLTTRENYEIDFKYINEDVRPVKQKTEEKPAYYDNDCPPVVEAELERV